MSLKLKFFNPGITMKELNDMETGFSSNICLLYPSRIFILAILFVDDIIFHFFLTYKIMSLSNSDFATIVNTVRETQAQLIPESTKFNHEAEKKIKKPKKVYTKAERERREAKKASYLEYKKTMDELSAKYRDRAKERREGKDETEQKDQNLREGFAGKFS